MDEWLTVKQASDQYKLSVSYLNRLLNKGRLKGRKETNPNGTYWMIEKRSLDAYMASDRKPGVKKQPPSEE